VEVLKMKGINPEEVGWLIEQLRELKKGEFMYELGASRINISKTRENIGKIYHFFEQSGVSAKKVDRLIEGSSSGIKTVVSHIISAISDDRAPKVADNLGRIISTISKGLKR
jgi:hypothetical protein